jgi:glycerate kinase
LTTLDRLSPREPVRRKILIAVNPFKETLSAAEVGACCAAGATSVGMGSDILPGSDGGDGLLDALRAAGHLSRETAHRVTGPSGGSVDVTVGWLDPHQVVVETASVVGLRLIPDNARNPLRATTRGLGELVVELAALGARMVFLGLGGSGTMDGGIGMATAWGWTPLDGEGRPLTGTGEATCRVAGFEPGRPPPVTLVGLVDVENPLTGADGARVYARQKGASPTEEERLAQGLDRLVEVVSARDAAQVPGAGAAGGLGFGILAFGAGSLRQGAPWVLDRLGFDARLASADGVLTAEGRFDRTSVRGKLPGEVLRRARIAQVPAALVAPQVLFRPEGLAIESGGGQWDAQELTRRAARALAGLFRLPPE